MKRGKVMGEAYSGDLHQRILRAADRTLLSRPSQSSRCSCKKRRHTRLMPLAGGGH